MRVTSPRMSATVRPPARTAAADIDELTGVGEVYLRSLLRTQLRLGLVVLVVVVAALASLPVLFDVAPRAATARLLGIPVPWLLLGFAVYPLLVAAAWWYVRLAERAERDFADLVHRR